MLTWPDRSWCSRVCVHFKNGTQLQIWPRRLNNFCLFSQFLSLCYCTTHLLCKTFTLCLASVNIQTFFSLCLLWALWPKKKLSGCLLVKTGAGHTHTHTHTIDRPSRKGLVWQNAFSHLTGPSIGRQARAPKARHTHTHTHRVSVLYLTLSPPDSRIV